MKHKIGNVYKCGTELTDSGLLRIVATIELLRIVAVDSTPPHPSGSVVSWEFKAVEHNSDKITPISFSVTKEELDKMELVKPKKGVKK